MTGVSGKFIPTRKVSAYTATDTNAEKVALKVPSAPSITPRKKSNTISLFLEEYFGRFWWMWIIVILMLKTKSI